VEGAECHWPLLQQFGASTLLGVDRSRGFEAFWREGLLAYDTLKELDWSWLARDGAMTQAAVGGLKKTGANPTDRGKQGVKRSLFTDAPGLPLSVVIAGANRHDMKLARSPLEAIVVKRPEPTVAQPQRLCLATIMPRFAPWRRNSTIRSTSGRGVKTCKPSHGRLVSCPINSLT